MRDASCEHQLNGIAGDMAKTAVSIFISELLTRSIPSQMADPELFGYIENAVLNLDSSDDSIAVFPLTFAVGLTQFMGFGPHNNFSESSTYFDLTGGNFCMHPPDHPYYLVPPLSNRFSELLKALSSGEAIIHFDYATRSELLTRILEYFRIHLPSFGELKSVQVLSDVLKD